MTIGKTNGLYLCFNAGCEGNKGGSLPWLVRRFSGKTEYETLRYIERKADETRQPLEDTVLAALTAAESRLPQLPQMKIDEMVENFWGEQAAIDYMRIERSFTDDTLRHFEVGWEPGLKMVITPIHDRDGNPIGVNGRAIDTKKFKLTKRLPRNSILFNLHRAKTAGGTAIMCESQFDVMRIHQAGFPNAICSLGSYVSKEQIALMQRYFDRVIIMTDADKAGRKMGYNLAAALRNMRVEWAQWDYETLYPHEAKDAGDMTDDEIRACINHSISDLEYQTFHNLS